MRSFLILWRKLYCLINVLLNRKGTFITDLLMLSSGTATSQIIPVITSIVISRIYSPQDFGVYAVFLSITGTIGIIASGRYELAIMLPDHDDDAKKLVVLSSLVPVIFGFFIIIFLGFIKLIELESFVDIQINSSYFFWIPISAILMGISQALLSWLNRNRMYKQMSFCQIMQAITTAIVTIFWGMQGFHENGLILGNIFGQITSLSGIIYMIGLKNLLDIIYTGKSGLKKIAIEYADFPKRSAPGGLLNTLSTQLPIIAIGTLYGAATVGLYSLTLKVLWAPVSFLGKAISQVFYQKATEARRQGMLNTLVKRTTRSLFLLFLGPMLIIGLYGDEMFVFAFGAPWREAGDIAQIMAPFYLVRFVFSLQSTLIMVVRRLDFEIIFNMAFLISQMGSLLIGHLYYDSITTSFVIMSLTGTLLFLYLGLFITKESEKMICGRQY